MTSVNDYMDWIYSKSWDTYVKARNAWMDNSRTEVWDCTITLQDLKNATYELVSYIDEKGGKEAKKKSEATLKQTSELTEQAREWLSKLQNKC